MRRGRHFCTVVGNNGTPISINAATPLSKNNWRTALAWSSIAELLGNTYKIVEKHYSAWVKDRQRLF